jgi:CTP:molybdopterin cytidylyltransferase MocA
VIGAAVLAAGASRRLGRPKQLLGYRGTTLLRAVTGEICESRCDRVAVVLGAHAGWIAPTLAGMRVAQLANVLWSEGIASSIRCAVAWAMQAALDALVLAVCDQPRLTAAHVDALIAVHRATGGAVASRYGDGPGVPAIFPARDYPRLCGLAGDEGARRLLHGADHVDWPDGAHDVDTPADLR